MYQIDGDNVYRILNDDDTGFSMQELFGLITKTETVRIDNEKVAEVTYEFDIQLGVYIEVSRTERNEPLPVPEPNTEEQITQLELENADLKSRLSDIELAFAEMIAQGGV